MDNYKDNERDSLFSRNVLGHFLIAFVIAVGIYFFLQKLDYITTQYDFYIRSQAVDGCYKVATKQTDIEYDDVADGSKKIDSSSWPDENWFNECMKKKGY